MYSLQSKSRSTSDSLCKYLNSRQWIVERRVATCQDHQWIGRRQSSKLAQFLLTDSELTNSTLVCLRSGRYILINKTAQLLLSNQAFAHGTLLQRHSGSRNVVETLALQPSW